MNPQSGAAGETGGHDLAGGRSNSLPAFVAAYGISLLGDRFAEIALPVLVLQVTGDPAAAGVVGVTVQVPPLVLALWLGGRVDRHSRRGLMVTADIARAICFGVFAFLAAGRVDELWPYLVVGLVVGAGNVLFAIAGTALLPQIVGGRHLVRANATLEAGDAMTAVLGPAAAGVVVAAVGTAAALSVDALSFAISANRPRRTQTSRHCAPPDAAPAGDCLRFATSR